MDNTYSVKFYNRANSTCGKIIYSQVGDKMPDVDIQELYLEWIEDYCNNKFDKGNLPGGVKLALNQLVEIDPLDFNITSEKLSDMSQSYANDGDIPKFIYKWINPYKRLKSL